MIFHNEDVRTVFEISREIFKGNFDKINTKYKDKELESELIRVIGKITDSTELMSKGNGKEVTSMCTALEKMKEDTRKEERKTMVTLMKHLFDAGRADEIERISTDEEYLETVMKEFGLV